MEQRAALASINPDVPQVLLHLATTYVHQGKLLQAVDKYNQIIRLSPDLADAHAELGFVLTRLKKYKDAEAAYQHASQLKPDTPQILSGLGLVYLRQRRNRISSRRYVSIRLSSTPITISG